MSASPFVGRVPAVVAGGALGLLGGLLAVICVLSPTAQQAAMCGGAGAASPAGEEAIPGRLVAIYQGAAARYNLGPDGWLYLASINQIETDFWTNQSVSSAGAVGPMQFEPDTWKTEGVDGDGDGVADINSEPDAIYSTAHYLHDSGAPGDWSGAIFTYNHASWYVSEVQANVAKWQSSGEAAQAQEISDPSAAADPRGPGPAGPHPGSSEASGTTSAGTIASQTLNSAAASTAAQAREGHVSFAVANANGRILAGYDAQRHVNGRSITKAMILIAYLDQHATDQLPQADQELLMRMIADSDNQAADTLYARLAPGAIQDVAEEADMHAFALSTSDPVYVLGRSGVTAADQARLFAMIDRLLPQQHRAYALQLLSSLHEGRWGILDAGLGVVPSKAGWQQESDGSGHGWTVNQAAQITATAPGLGVAVTTVGQPSFRYGQQSIQQVITALDLSAGSTSVVDADLAGGCTGQPAPGPIDSTLEPGQRSHVLPSGQASVPADAPREVQNMIIAGNRIVQRFPYVWGGGHANATSDMAPDPKPVGGGYDCSGSVSYTLWGGGPRLQQMLGGGPQTSGTLESFGIAGPGRFVTLHSNAGHVFMLISGVWMNTGHHTDGTAPKAATADGPHWGNTPPDPGYDSAFTIRHPGGL